MKQATKIVKTFVMVVVVTMLAVPVMAANGNGINKEACFSADLSIQNGDLLVRGGNGGGGNGNGGNGGGRNGDADGSNDGTRPADGSGNGPGTGDCLNA